MKLARKILAETWLAVEAFATGLAALAVAAWLFYGAVLLLKELSLLMR